MNARLQRTEFMPFASYVLLDERIDFVVTRRGVCRRC